MHSLTDDEVETMLADSYEHAQEDFDRGRLANLKTEIGTMIKACESHVDDAKDALDKESIADLRDAIAASREVLASEDVEEVQKARDQLERASLPLAAALMDSVARQALAGKNLEDV